MRMGRTAVVIATVDRQAALIRLVAALTSQTLLPDTIIISTPTIAGIPPGVRNQPRVQVVVGERGASRQRNAGIEQLDPTTEFVFFFDDDAVPREDYIEKAVRLLQCSPTIVGLTGRLARDGAAEGRELSETEITEAIGRSRHQHASSVTDVRSLYGCNMCVRFDALVGELFDERLPMYSWLEDLDLSRRLARRGRIVRYDRCVAVHQGSSSGGRTQHRRFGYSSVINPLYLWRKGSIEVSDAVVLVGRPMLANVLGLLLPRESAWRRQRLQGMLRALRDLICGHLEPERAQLM